ncbi:hypothetical protein CDAR_177581 [Caerostris darwini]|uniref:Uncharacterized protein n=1 Tax=Caerostris darwini TaxID=1538125 RepID=A0AAV4P4L0_9ARAC|nr:hypothetical protein CDAR_177581 [Caerostris darwini]
MFSVIQFKTFLPQNNSNTVRLGIPSLSHYGAKSYRPSLPLTLLVTSQEKRERKALMESFRSEENHPFTKDAFLITLFDMRNQSGKDCFQASQQQRRERAATFQKMERGAIWIGISGRLF